MLQYILFLNLFVAAVQIEWLVKTAGYGDHSIRSLPKGDYGSFI